MAKDFAFKKGPRKESESKWSDRVEGKIYDEQHAMIKKRFGKDTADKANYGWGVSADKGFISAATKVYHKSGAKVILSEAQHPSDEINHDWRDY